MPKISFDSVGKTEIKEPKTTEPDKKRNKSNSTVRSQTKSTSYINKY